LHITFASSKGGVGKSTACACLAGALVARGHTVHIVDLDNNHTVSRWLSRSKGFSVSTPDPLALTEHLDMLAKKSLDFVLIDVAGAYERAITVAMARAHLTIIPAAPTEADLFEANRIATHLRSVFAAFNREPLFRLLLTQVQPLASHAQSHAIREVDRLALPRFYTMLTHRAAYQEIGLSGSPPHQSNRTRSTTAKAVAEIDQWLAEIALLLPTQQPINRKDAA